MLSKHLALLATPDVDPTSVHPTAATLRFLDFSDPRGSPTPIDIPLASLLAGAAGAPSDLNRTSDTLGLWPRYGVQWDTRDMLVLSYVEMDAPARLFESKAWLVKMDSNMLQSLGLP